MILQMLRQQIPPKKVSNLLNELYNSQRSPLGHPHIIPSMKAVVLGTMYNRMEDMKASPASWYDYATLMNMQRECDELSRHPLLSKYTDGVVWLSFFEWKEKLDATTIIQK